jgi:amylosucrase
MPDPVSGERRTSGTGASLAGIEKAIKLKDEKLLNLAIERYLCAYTMVFGFGGIPLLYMGDEIGLLNDHSYLKDETKAEDNRWLHRPKMNWKVADAAAAGELDDKPAGRIYHRMKHVIEVRKSLPSLHARVATVVRKGTGQGVVLFDREHPAGHLVQVYNLSESTRWLSASELGGLSGNLTDHLTGHTFDIGEGMPLAPYEMRWFTQAR